MAAEKSFHHITVLLEESIEALDIKPDGVYIDATFGGGGHSRLLMSKLGPKGKLIAFDQDKDAWQNAIDDERFILVKENFKYISEFLEYLGYPQVDGVLADLGVSSHQFDTAERGFSIRFDAPLDMRMDDRVSLTAAEVVNTYSQKQLQDIFEKYGQVRNAKTLAQMVVDRRSVVPIRTIEDFKKLLEPLIKGNPNKYLAQVFQSIRIEVNKELEVLESFLYAAVDCLKPGGRLCVITFHSLEDRIVKQFMKSGGVSGEKDEFGRLKNAVKMKPLSDIEPSAAELRINNRSRSARLRVGLKY